MSKGRYEMKFDTIFLSGDHAVDMRNGEDVTVVVGTSPGEVAGKEGYPIVVSYDDIENLEIVTHSIHFLALA